MVTLTDKSIMTWGKYQGYTLANVPASYLLWIYDNLTLTKALRTYIEQNEQALQQEAKNAARENRR